MLDVRQVRQLIIKPALEPLGLWSQIVENLLIGTALQESGLHWLAQENGPAVGIYQIEPKTYDWIKGKIRDHILYPKIINICGLCYLPNDPAALIWNLRYATVVCRFRYLEVKAPLPETNNISLIADYWKQWYNTPEGAGKAEEFINNYNRNNQN